MFSRFDVQNLTADPHTYLAGVSGRSARAGPGVEQTIAPGAVKRHDMLLKWVHADCIISVSGVGCFRAPTLFS